MKEFMKDLEKKLCRELETMYQEVSRRQRLSEGELRQICHYLKGIHYAGEIQKNESGGYSNDGRWQAEGQYSGNNSHGHHDDNYYSNENGMSHDGYSGRRSHDGYSNHGEEKMVHKLNDMMGQAQSEEQRRMIRRWISEIENK